MASHQRVAQNAQPPAAPGVMPMMSQEEPMQEPGMETPVQAQTPPEPPTPAVPPSPPAPGVQAAAPVEPTIESYIDEKEKEGQSDDVSHEEMGITPQAAYRSVYAHLKLRSTASRDLEVFDPTTNSVMMTVRPNMKTKASNESLRNFGVAVLRSIASDGLTRTAERTKAKVRTASGGVVDFGDNTFAKDDKPDYENPGNGINAGGDSNYAGTQPGSAGLDTSVNSGENADRKELHQTREAPGLAGKPLLTKGASARRAADEPICSECKGDGIVDEKECESCSGKGYHPKEASRWAQNAPMSADGPPKEIVDKGSLGGRVTNLSDNVNQRAEGNALSVTDDYDSNMRDDRKPYNKGDAVTDGEIDTFANESITAGARKAQSAPMAPNPEMPMQAQAPTGAPPAPEMPMQAQAPVEEGNPAMAPEQEQQLTAYIKAKVAKETHESTRNFIAKFVRCVRLSARRQAMNLEPNNIKIAMADALMTPAMLSRHEEFRPMDERTATFVIEQGLNVTSALSYTDSLISGAQRFFKMSDQALAQVEEDLAAQTPASPQPVAQVEPPAENEMPMQAGHYDEQSGHDAAIEPELEADPADHVANRRLASAMGGNLPVNPSGNSQPGNSPQTDKRMNVRAALNQTRGAAFTNHLANKFG